MRYSYHTHTVRCGHASGTEEEYAAAAEKNGLEVLGFSDHGPYVFPGGYYSGFRMRTEDARDYCLALDALRRKLREDGSQLRIAIGYELEYYPRHFRQTLDLLARSGAGLPGGGPAAPEYLILGQHYTVNEYDGEYSGAPTHSEATLASYVDSAVAGMETGCFTYMAHPDLLYYTGPEKIYELHMRRLIDAAEQTGVPLEINLLGLMEGRNYPRELFWSMAAESGCRVVLGCDSHQPRRVCDPEEIASGTAFALRFGLSVTDMLTLRDPLKGKV